MTNNVCSMWHYQELSLVVPTLKGSDMLYPDGHHDARAYSKMKNMRLKAIGNSWLSKTPAQTEQPFLLQVPLRWQSWLMTYNLRSRLPPIEGSFKWFFPLPFLPAILLTDLFAFISAPTGFHDWGSVTRWTHSTTDHLANCCLPSTPKDWSTMKAELTE